MALARELAHRVIDLAGSGRVYCQLTDCDTSSVTIDLPVQRVLRRLDRGGGFHNYFWKARPA